MAETQPILLKKEGNIATICLQRPHVHNALNETVIQRFSEYLGSLEKDPEISIVILKGAGNNFCSGADIEWMKKSIHYSIEKNEEDALSFAKLLNLFYHFNKPTITVVQGTVFGGAIGLVACSDITIASLDTTFCFSEVKLGLIPAVISPYIIPILGVRQATRFMLTAEPFLAEKAYSMGLVHYLAPQENLDNELFKIVQLFNNNGPLAMAQLKKHIKNLTDVPHSLQEQMQQSAQLIAKLRISKEAQEGLSAFLEKRAPSWQKNILNK